MTLVMEWHCNCVQVNLHALCKSICHTGVVGTISEAAGTVHPARLWFPLPTRLTWVRAYEKTQPTQI